MDVGNFVLGAKQEGLFAVSLFQPIKSFVGDNLGGMPVHFRFSFGGKKSGVEIGTLSALTGKNFPRLEFVRRVTLEVPLPDHAGLVAGFSKFPWIHPLTTVPLGRVSDDTIGLAVLAGEDGGSTGAADGIDVEGMSEEGAFLCDPVEVWGLVDRTRVGPDGAQGMIIAKEKKNIRSVFRLQRNQESESGKNGFYGMLHL